MANCMRITAEVVIVGGTCAVARSQEPPDSVHLYWQLLDMPV